MMWRDGVISVTAFEGIQYCIYVICRLWFLPRCDGARCCPEAHTLYKSSWPERGWIPVDWLAVKAIDCLNDSSRKTPKSLPPYNCAELSLPCQARYSWFNKNTHCWTLILFSIDLCWGSIHLIYTLTFRRSKLNFTQKHIMHIIHDFIHDWSETRYFFPKISEANFFDKSSPSSINMKWLLPKLSEWRNTWVGIKIWLSQKCCNNPPN